MQVEPYEDRPDIQGAVNMVLRLRWDRCFFSDRVLNRLLVHKAQGIENIDVDHSWQRSLEEQFKNQHVPLE